MAEFVVDYFLHKFGLQKMATEKSNELLAALQVFVRDNGDSMDQQITKNRSRAKLFLTTLGLGSDPMLYSRDLGDFYSSFLATVFGSGDAKITALGERMSRAQVAVPRDAAARVLLGPKGKSSNTNSWKIPPQLLKVATKSQIRGLLRRIEALPAAAIKRRLSDSSSGSIKTRGESTKRRASEAVPSNGHVRGSEVDFDALEELVIGQYFDWFSEAQKRLKGMFSKYDVNENGLEFNEFSELCRDGLRRTDLDDRGLMNLWRGILDKVDGQTEEFLIRDMEIFAMAALQLGLFPPVEQDGTSDELVEIEADELSVELDQVRGARSAFSPIAEGSPGANADERKRRSASPIPRREASPLEVEIAAFKASAENLALAEAAVHSVRKSSPSPEPGKVSPPVEAFEAEVRNTMDAEMIKAIFV